MLNNGVKNVVQPSSVAAAAGLLRVQAGISRQRRVLLLSGEQAWAVEQARLALAAVGLLPGAGWLGDTAPAGSLAVTPSKISPLLGQELSVLVVDAYSGFDPDAIGAAVGALCGGGLLLLLTPPLPQWGAYADPQHARITVAPYGPEAVSGRFLQRLARLLANSEDVYRIEQGQALPALLAAVAASPPPVPPPPYASEDQRLAVAALRRAATGRARRPLVLIADRGRGKSAALGMAAAELLAAGPARVLLTGPRLDAVRTVFDHAARQLPQARREAGVLAVGDGWLRFIAPDALAAELPPADLLLVDEAAAIPVPLLNLLLRHYPRIAFTTTVHGYEGTGRGFLLRFGQTLAQQAPGRRLLRLETPVRWAPDDPLERLSFRLLLLDAEAAPAAAVATASPATTRIERLDRETLAQDEARLTELFGLLLQAHYRTRPFDLRHLLDGPNVEVYVQLHADHVVGAALVALEGGLESEIAAAVAGGERRLRGHLIPQSLAFHLGLVDGAQLRCSRVMRLAVHPACRQQGLGRRLLEAVAADATERGLDLVGSSFGGDAPLLRFWQRCGFSPVRVGMTRTSSSGEHALLLLRSLAPTGEALLAQARRQFLRDLPDQLLEPLRELEPALVLRLLQGRHTAAEEVDAADLRQLQAFAFSRRGYGDTMAALRRFILNALTQKSRSGQLSGRQWKLLVMKVLQGRHWNEVARLCGWSGRAETEQAVREAIGRLLGEQPDGK